MWARFALPACALLAAPASAWAQAPDLRWRAYAQLAAEHLDGDAGIDFGADRMRFAALASSNRLSGGAQLDLGVPDPSGREPGSVLNGLLDVFVDYRLAVRHRLRAGEFKTSLGMDFNIGGHLLELTKRGMDAGLVLARDAGVMVIANGLGRGFGYDIGIFNIAGRSLATDYNQTQEGEDNAFAARGRFDSGPWHAEWAYGDTAAAGGPGTADYGVADAALRYQGGALTVKLEWIGGEHVRGDRQRREQVYYVHGAYRIQENYELVARHYAGRSKLAGQSTDLSNSYIGFSWWPYERDGMQGRLQLNYVFAGGDGHAYTGVQGFRDNALFVQFQFLIQR